MRPLLLVLAGCSGKTGTTDSATDAAPTDAGPPPTDGPIDSGTPPETDTTTDGTTPVAHSAHTGIGHSEGGTTPTSPLPPPVVTDQCQGYPADTWLSGTQYVPELHIFGIYESDPAPNNAVTLQIERPGSVAIVLSSYVAAHWNLVVDPAATLDGVLLSGYEQQTVSVTDPGGAPLAVPISNRSPYNNNWLGVIAYSTDPGYQRTRTEQLILEAEAVTGLDATGFYGCYHSTGFRLQ